MKKKVSIIMPTYKGAQIIEASIQSILNQQYENLELIIVDDNGKGTKEQCETEKIINKFLPNDKVIYLIHDINKNGSAARNTGIRKASGYYVAFLDDDDCFLPDKIQKQVELFEQLSDEYGLVYGGLEERYASGKKRIILPQKVDDFLFEYLVGKLYVCSSTIMLRMEAIKKTGFWDESFQRHQDMEYIVRVASTYKTSYINEACIIKERVDRDLPQDAIKVEKYRLHYLSKMMPYIQRYDKRRQSEIYFFNYLSIGKAYLKNRKIKKAIYYAMISKMPIRMFLKYFSDAIKFIKKENIKNV